jgi:hypothetical protein
MQEEFEIVINERLTRLSLRGRIEDMLADGLSKTAALSLLREELDCNTEDL